MNVVVTGASRGIGQAVAKEFLHRGFKVIAIARDFSVWKVNKPSNLWLIEADLSEQLAIDAAVWQVRKIFGKIDILINNAGYLTKGNIADAFSDEVNKMWRINVLAPGYLTSCLIDQLSASGIGHVVNISSMAGYQGSAKFPGIAFYSATKGAIATLTECMAAEYTDTGVSFNALSIGAVDTEMLQLAFPGYKAPVSLTQMAVFIADFATNAGTVMSGRVVPVTLTNPK